jgi:hypothetical protein
MHKAHEVTLRKSDLSLQDVGLNQWMAGSVLYDGAERDRPHKLCRECWRWHLKHTHMIDQTNARCTRNAKHDDLHREAPKSARNNEVDN